MINWLKVKQKFRDWWKIRGDYDRFRDNYGLTHAAVENHLLEAIRFRETKDQVILLLTHFPETFERIQGRLEEAALAHEIGPLRLGPEYLRSLREPSHSNSASIVLALATTLDDASLDRPQEVRRDFQVSMMVLERHPKVTEDNRIDQFARVWPFSIRLGYLLSLEDPVIQTCIHPTVIELLKQMGLRDQQLVTSELVTRGLERYLRRVKFPDQHPASGQRVAAESAADWLKFFPPQAHVKQKTAES